VSVRRLRCLIVVALMGLGGCASASGAHEGRDYYFSPRGDDRRGDGTAASPWATLAKASSLTLGPGDRVLLEGGAKFAGTMVLDEEDGGVEGRPAVIGSYGEGRAVIEAGEGPGVLVRNCGNVIVRDLVVSGGGAGTNLGSGVAFVNEKSGGGRGKWMRGIVVSNVDAGGFGLEGIYLDALAGNGFEGVRIENCTAHDNGHCGIYVSGRREMTHKYGHRDVSVAGCCAYRNLGDPREPDQNRSGSGIFLTGVEKGVVERSVAYENGRLGRARHGGPMGIWVSESDGVVIQHCESYANQTGGNYDGGGFGIDGGATRCVLQYNYSHDNEGSGYGLFQYTHALPWRDNAVRYNVSENDGRRNGYAGIHVWNGGTGIRGAWIYHNTVVMRSAGSVGKDGGTKSLWVQSGVEGLRVLNNVFVAPPGVCPVEIAAEQRDPVMAGNCYWGVRGEVCFDWQGLRCLGIEEFRRKSGQERGAGWVADPKFVGVGKGMERYAPEVGSVLIGGAVDLRRWRIGDGGRDVGAVQKTALSTSDFQPFDKLRAGISTSK
jgi:Right handed beta helix region